VVEEGGAGDAAVGDPHRVGAGVTGQLRRVEVPRCPRGGVVIEEDSGVLGVDIAGVVAGGDRVEPVGADELGPEPVVLQVLGAHPAHRQIQAAVGDPGGLGMGGLNSCV
jgi:hypothetical protein